MTEAEDNQPVILRITAPRAPVPLHKPVRLAVDYFALDDSQCQNITVDWGDGTLDRILRTRCGRAHDRHRYAKPGAYAIIVTITDAAGASTQELVRCVVSRGLGLWGWPPACRLPGPLAPPAPPQALTGWGNGGRPL